MCTFLRKAAPRTPCMCTTFPPSPGSRTQQKSHRAAKSQVKYRLLAVERERKRAQVASSWRTLLESRAHVRVVWRTAPGHSESQRVPRKNRRGHGATDARRAGPPRTYGTQGPAQRRRCRAAIQKPARPRCVDRKAPEADAYLDTRGFRQRSERRAVVRAGVTSACRHSQQTPPGPRPAGPPPAAPGRAARPRRAPPCRSRLPPGPPRAWQTRGAPR